MADFIPILFDKSHLSTLGERMYTQSLDLIRELVANSYDADATEVKITIGSDNSILVEDNGSGMNREGLRQYFTIGSGFKKENPLSPKFNRVRIGEFGIGKFAVLSICDRFEIYTRSGSYAATLIFDKNDFEARNDWNIPLIEQQADSSDSGTRISLFKIKKEILVTDVERHLINIFPLTDKNFSIFLNSIKLAAKHVSGQRFRIREETVYGPITGEVIISSLVLNKEQTGIGIRVKGVLIKRETFNLESAHTLSVRRLTGEVNADFLAVTSSRNDLVTDTPMYQEFYKVIAKTLRKVVKQLEKSAESYQDKKAEKILSDALSTIRTAMKKNADILLLEGLPLFSTKNTSVDNQANNQVVATALTKESRGNKKTLGLALKKIKPKIRSRIRTLLRDQSRIVKKVRIGGHDFLVSFAHLGEEEKESFAEGGIIFINRDHRLFKNIETKSELVLYHLIRLVTQEIIKLTNPKDLEVAYDWQGKLIRDAFLSFKSE